jgi:hypothetical protein
MFDVELTSPDPWGTAMGPLQGDACQRCGGTGRTPEGRVCPKCYGSGGRRPAPRPVKLVCTSCGQQVRQGESSQDTYDPDGCDHWYQAPGELTEMWGK